MQRLPFDTIDRLPQYVFAVVNDLKARYRGEGKDIIDFGMGNPDQPTPAHIVDKLVEASRNERNHKYSVSRGIFRLRKAVSEWYKSRYDVDIDPDEEAIIVMGAKEGYSHLALATINRGDLVIVPTPSYSIHMYAMVIAGAQVMGVPVEDPQAYLEGVRQIIRTSNPRPKFIVASYPHNPTTAVVDKSFFEQLVAIAKEANVYIIHDIAYADIVFDGYRAPSIFEVPGAKDVAIEFMSLSKSYNMAGWRVGFAAGNRDLVNALKKIKSYLDYGMFQPIQIAAIRALTGPQDCVEDIRRVYEQRRNVVIETFGRAGWQITPPKATMFVWAPIPDQFKSMGSLEFSKLLVSEADVSVSPGIGFGQGGDGHVRIALIENEHRIRQAARNIRTLLEKRG